MRTSRIPTRLTRLLTAGAAATLLLSACTGGGDEAADEATLTAEESQAAEGTTDEAGGDDDAGDTAGDETPADEGASADDAIAQLTATTPDGETITIGDFAGSPVLVETFATWCSTCRAQLGDTQAAAVEAGDDAVFLVLSVETDLDPAGLEEYAAENGFDDVVFAVLDADGLVTLQDRFGGSVLVPPSTPKFRVGADGTVSELTTGRESAEEILASIDA